MYGFFHPLLGEKGYPYSIQQYSSAELKKYFCFLFTMSANSGRLDIGIYVAVDIFQDGIGVASQHTVMVH